MSGEYSILVHGIWMNGLDMGLLQRRLMARGYHTTRFHYNSVSATPAENARQLGRLVETIEQPVIHFICHSLGGLVLRHLFHLCPEQKPGRVVTLGTPHRCSSAAGQLSRIAVGRILLGKSMDSGLLGGAPAWQGRNDLGVIAGTLRLGIGMLIPGIPAPNDGSVAVEETCLERMKDHIVLPVSHTGMLFSHTVFEQTAYFLERGVFRR